MSGMCVRVYMVVLFAFIFEKNYVYMLKMFNICPGKSVFTDLDIKLISIITFIGITSIHTTQNVMVAPSLQII